MKARWLIITLLLAFPFAFAFFLSEARVGERRAAKPALVVARPLGVPVHAARPASSDIGPIGPMTPVRPISESSAPASRSPNDETVELSNGGFTVPPKPTLLTGTFTREDDSLIYDADAKLRLSKDVILSSPTGVMVSNEKQTVFAGDMQIESGKNIITAHEGVLDTSTNQMKATVASISFTNENNQMVRMTGENVTLELPTAGKSPPYNTVVADSVTVESTTTAAASTPTP